MPGHNPKKQSYCYYLVTDVTASHRPLSPTQHNPLVDGELNLRLQGTWWILSQWMLEDRLGGAGIVEKKEEEAGAGAAEKKKEEAGAVEKKELAGTVEKKELTGPMEKKEVGPAVWIVGERMEAAAAA
ncbi:hypothetical protein SERLADRAFT_434165 [Serpula lacrymans var. lacrymans S7.9]|uniref:Uncharacterized protein n=1 Tax=Serpula lacrymans var. lacrymans (strain S7.9) TaxID=578457 RepID=F8NJQ2_SERL9|nr:uncharacterized protein SERLADRAFT_434165 [Serpula lacrymans var. lacrymans S7.9]EGO28267.1 hypothetical protein SERLADRAFT_434165 [Serpula lacrymans var. lacrymans S7.9]